MKEFIGKITKHSEGEFIYCIVIKKVKTRPEYIKNYNSNTKGNNKAIYRCGMEKIKYRFVYTGIN
ncbi:hypothetical protein AGMMS49940_06640 [Spirochaetia bacterium]|nr:hypothetical protein AGMMS49940_06640 [Spirochaetia bacterium]